MSDDLQARLFEAAQAIDWIVVRKPLESDLPLVTDLDFGFGINRIPRHLEDARRFCAIAGPVSKCEAPCPARIRLRRDGLIRGRWSILRKRDDVEKTGCKSCKAQY